MDDRIETMTWEEFFEGIWHAEIFSGESLFLIPLLIFIGIFLRVSR